MSTKVFSFQQASVIAHIDFFFFFFLLKRDGAEVVCIYNLVTHLIAKMHLLSSYLFCDSIYSKTFDLLFNQLVARFETWRDKKMKHVFKIPDKRKCPKLIAETVAETEKKNTKLH